MNMTRSGCRFRCLSKKNCERRIRIDAIEVFPMAVPGYTSQQGFAWLKRDIDELQPDMVIASFGWNDASMSDMPDREAIRTDWYPVTVRWLIDHSQALAHVTRWLRNRNGPTAKSKRRPQPRVSEYEYVRNIKCDCRPRARSSAGRDCYRRSLRDSTTNPGEAALMTKYEIAFAFKHAAGKCAVS